jgi:hypothetical protein
MTDHVSVWVEELVVTSDMPPFPVPEKDGVVAAAVDPAHVAVHVSVFEL